MPSKVPLVIIVLFGLSTFLFGCDSCKKTFTITFSGNVADGSNSPLSGVNVALVLSDGSQSVVGTTDVNGDYSYSWYRRASLSVSRIVFSKTGFTDGVSTKDQTYGKHCNSAAITTDIQLTP